MIILIGIFNLLGLTLSGTFELKEFMLLSLTPIFSSVVIFFICLYLSTYTHKTKKMFSISLGIVFISYILNVLSDLADKIKFLRYLSVYTLSDIRNVIINDSINLLMPLICIFMSVVLLTFTIRRYNKKDLV